MFMIKNCSYALFLVRFCFVSLLCFLLSSYSYSAVFSAKYAIKQSGFQVACLHRTTLPDNEIELRIKVSNGQSFDTIGENGNYFYYTNERAAYSYLRQTDCAEPAIKGVFPHYSVFFKTLNHWKTTTFKLVEDNEGAPVAVERNDYISNLKPFPTYFDFSKSVSKWASDDSDCFREQGLSYSTDEDVSSGRSTPTNASIVSVASDELMAPSASSFPSAVSASTSATSPYKELEGLTFAESPRNTSGLSSPAGCSDVSSAVESYDWNYIQFSFANMTGGTGSVTSEGTVNSVISLVNQNARSQALLHASEQPQSRHLIFGPGLEKKLTMLANGELSLEQCLSPSTLYFPLLMSNILKESENHYPHISIHMGAFVQYFSVDTSDPALKATITHKEYENDEGVYFVYEVNHQDEISKITMIDIDETTKKEVPVLVFESTSVTS